MALLSSVTSASDQAVFSVFATCAASCSCCSNERRLSVQHIALQRIVLQHSTGFLHDYMVSPVCSAQIKFTVFVSDWPRVCCCTMSGIWHGNCCLLFGCHIVLTTEMKWKLLQGVNWAIYGYILTKAALSVVSPKTSAAAAVTAVWESIVRLATNTPCSPTSRGRKMTPYRYCTCSICIFSYVETTHCNGSRRGGGGYLVSIWHSLISLCCLSIFLWLKRTHNTLNTTLIKDSSAVYL